ncbi:MAG: 4'-phosphopantetheinyl transferase superfamily protein [Fulvivirga sp.]
MPVNRTIKVSEDRHVCIWHVDESFDELLQQLSPNHDDLELLTSFRNSKKQLEWLAGRLTLKHLCQILDIEYNGIIKDEHGKPSLRGHNYEISLTHSFPYVASIIDVKLPVGIDLEQPREKILRIAHKFLSSKELDFCKNNIILLNAAWCAKEALYKIYGKKGLIFNEHIALEPYDTDRDSLITGNIIVNDIKESYNLRCEVGDKYILAYNV